MTSFFRAKPVRCCVPMRLPKSGASPRMTSTASWRLSISSTTTKGLSSVPLPVAVRIENPPSSSLNVSPPTEMGAAAALPVKANQRRQPQISGDRRAMRATLASPQSGSTWHCTAASVSRTSADASISQAIARFLLFLLPSCHPSLFAAREHLVDGVVDGIGGGIVAFFEQLSVNIKRHSWIGVAEALGYLHLVNAGVDQLGGVRMPESVKRDAADADARRRPVPAL